MSNRQDLTVKKEPPNDLDDLVPPKNFGGPLPSFKWLVDGLLEKLSVITSENHWYINQTKRDRKLKIVDQFIKEWRNTVGSNIYPALVLVLPTRDRERNYNIKDLKLGKYLLEILKIPKKSPDYDHIMNWKQFTKLPGQIKRQDSNQQKMSTVCVELLKKRKQDIPGGVLSIEDVNNLLDNLANGEYKKEDQIIILREAIDKMSFLELQYFFDIILKNRIDKGMENTILYYWHPDAVNYLSVVSRLKTVLYKLSDPNKRLKKQELSVNIGQPFKPQLSKKPAQNYAKIAESLKNDFYIEEKMDGERIQLHYVDKGKSTLYFSRKGMEYTFIYGSNITCGCISPHLKFSNGVKNCVLDGEMVTFDPKTKTFLPFGCLKGSAILELKRQYGEDSTTGDLNQMEIDPNDNENPRPFFVVFDLVYLNDTPMTQYPLNKRKNILSNIVAIDETNKEFIQVIESVRASDEEEIKNSLTNAIEKGSEGIILKKYDSFYYIDKRLDLWTKIKPEYLEEFGENIDLIVIGREISKKNKYLCGLRVTTNDTECYKEPKFYSFCRVANGFDLEDERKIDQVTKGKWKNIKDEYPSNDLIEFGKRLPSEWIDPRDSFVLEVKARSIDKSISKNYKTSTTLYNAYSRQIRLDKDWEDATTIDEYMEIKESRKSTDDKEHRLLQRKKKSLIDEIKKQSIDEENWNYLLASVKSNIFENYTFMILSDSFQDNKRISVNELSIILKQNGGSITKNQQLIKELEKLIIISDKKTLEEIELYRNGFDIIKSKWIFDCLRNGKVIKTEPKHCFNVNEVMLKNSIKRINEYGVSFINKISKDELKQVIDKYSGVKTEKDVKLEDSASIKEILRDVSVFNGLKIFIVSKEDSIELRILKNKIRLNNGMIVNSVNECNLIVNYDESKEKIDDLRKEITIDFKEGTKIRRIVNVKWVRDSLENGYRVDQQDYPV